MTEMAHGTVVVQSGEAVVTRWWRTVDRVTISCVLALFCIGLLLGFAASPPLALRNGHAPFYYVERQAIFGILALVTLFAASMFSPLQIRRLASLGFLAAFLAIALLPVFGTDFGKGAVRWYSLGFASLQPSEFLKPVFTIVIAWLIAADQEIAGPPGKTISFGLTLAIVGLLAIQPDFGQSVLVLFVWCVIYFVAGAPMGRVAAFGAAFLGAGYLAYQNSEHFARRIDGFFSPTLDPYSQLARAENAIREGGILGAGVGEGAVIWSLPDAHTDFIIAVAAEEYGLMMVLGIIGLYATIALRSYFRLMRERDPFIRLAGTGLVSLLSLQAFINLGVAVRILPAKGMTLPFVSYGGSSLIATGLLVGMLLCLTRTRAQNQIEDHLLTRGRR